MNAFETYKKTQYLPYLKDINKILSPEIQKTLLEIFPSNIIAILNLIIHDFNNKMNAPYKESKKFYEHVLFPLNYVKERTGLSRKEQQKALEILDKLSLIQYDYHNETRCVYLLAKNFKHFNKQLIQKYINMMSKPNHNLIELVEIYNEYIQYIWDLELD